MSKEIDEYGNVIIHRTEHKQQDDNKVYLCKQIFSIEKFEEILNTDCYFLVLFDNASDQEEGPNDELGMIKFMEIKRSLANLKVLFIDPVDDDINDYKILKDFIEPPVDLFKYPTKALLIKHNSVIKSFYANIATILNLIYQYEGLIDKDIEDCPNIVNFLNDFMSDFTIAWHLSETVFVELAHKIYKLRDIGIAFDFLLLLVKPWITVVEMWSYEYIEWNKKIENPFSLDRDLIKEKRLIKYKEQLNTYLYEVISSIIIDYVY